MRQWIAHRPQRLAASFGKALLDILFPPICHNCRAFMPNAGALHICDACLEKSPAIVTPLCTKCGTPFHTVNGIDHLCGTCLINPPGFVAARSAVAFTGPVRELIHLFKYEAKVHLRRPLGLLTAELLSEFARTSTPELLIPVPLHKKRLRQRSFNQAVLLAEVLAASWQIPLCRAILQRCRWTEPQINLNHAERMSNVRGAFAVSNPEKVRGKRVMLVDDVYTTGSTVAECARVLRKAGAEAVFVVTTARAITTG